MRASNQRPKSHESQSMSSSFVYSDKLARSFWEYICLVSRGPGWQTGMLVCWTGGGPNLQEHHSRNEGIAWKRIKRGQSLVHPNYSRCETRVFCFLLLPVEWKRFFCLLGTARVKCVALLVIGSEQLSQPEEELFPITSHKNEIGNTRPRSQEFLILYSTSLRKARQEEGSGSNAALSWAMWHSEHVHGQHLIFHVAGEEPAWTHS